MSDERLSDMAASEATSEIKREEIIREAASEERIQLTLKAFGDSVARLARQRLDVDEMRRRHREAEKLMDALYEALLSEDCPLDDLKPETELTKNGAVVVTAPSKLEVLEVLSRSQARLEKLIFDRMDAERQLYSLTGRDASEATKLSEAEVRELNRRIARARGG